MRLTKKHWSIVQYKELGLILFLLGIAVAGFLFFLIQILNSYPFWDYINGYRLSLTPFTGIYGDISYLPWPFQFFRFTQLFDAGVALAFVGLFVWGLADNGGLRRRGVAAALGLTLLVAGTICAVIVYLQIDVLTGTNLPWGAYAWASERVAYNTQFTGAEYNCTFLNYGQLLYISAAMALVGFLLYCFYGRSDRKGPPLKLVALLFGAGLALLAVGLLLMFPGVKFSAPDPSMSATPYAVEGALILWAGAALLMASIIGSALKLKEAFELAKPRLKTRFK